ncbi:MAG: hypothetical protein KAT77_06015 [Nanoarchaeota archaeon]|nr:hypothetical protein [Nanoarchaeota archaeon]
MTKEVKNSYDIDKEAQRSVVEQGLTISYFTNTLGAIKSLGITSVRDVPHDHSDMPNYHFLNTLINTKNWLNEMAEAYAKENTQLNGLEALLQGDPLTKAAIQYRWDGLFQPEDEDSQEHYQHLAFSVVWQHEKTTKFRELVEKYWSETKQKQQPSEPAQPGFLKRTLHYLGRRALDTAVITMLLAPPIYVVSKYLVIPQAASYLIETVRPEIITELEFYYRTHGRINVKEVSQGLLEIFPKLKFFQDDLESAVKEEAKKLEQEKKQQEQKPLENTEEDF